MATIKKIDPRHQFSKRLARYGAIVWGVYAFAVLGLIAYRPEAAMAAVWLTLIMTCNKALDTVSYTRNSITEKIILGALARTKMQFGLGDVNVSFGDDENKEEGDNG